MGDAELSARSRACLTLLDAITPSRSTLHNFMKAKKAVLERLLRLEEKEMKTQAKELSKAAASFVVTSKNA